MSAVNTGALRGEAYGVLAALLGEPDQAVLELCAGGGAAGVLAEVLHPVGSPTPDHGSRESIALANLASPPATLDEWKQAHWDAFRNPMAFRVTPVESVYRPWSELPGDDTGMGGAKGYLMSDRALHLRELYRMAGVAVPGEFEAMPDHLALELEFMALLCRHRGSADQLQFLQDHLTWVDLLARDAHRKGIPAFYAAVLDLVACLVQQDEAYLRRAAAGVKT